MLRGNLYYCLSLPGLIYDLGSQAFFARSKKEEKKRFPHLIPDKISAKVIADLDRNTYNFNSI